MHSNNDQQPHLLQNTMVFVYLLEQRSGWLIILRANSDDKLTLSRKMWVSLALWPQKSYRAFLRGGVYDSLKPQTQSTRTEQKRRWERNRERVSIQHAGKMMPYKSLHSPSQLWFQFFMAEVCWNGPDRRLLVCTLHYSLAPLRADFIYVDKVLEGRFLSSSTSQISSVSVQRALE